MAKHIPSIRRVFTTIVPFGIIVCAGCSPKVRDPLPDLPRLVLWAWEEPEDLRWIDPHEVGVAFFAGSIRIGDEGVAFTPRLRALQVPSGTRMIAVVRVVGTSSRAPVERTAVAIADTARLPHVRAVQIDFDALASQREFYAALVKAVHAKLPPNMPLLITALLSWCVGDRTWAGTTRSRRKLCTTWFAPHATLAAQMQRLQSIREKPTHYCTNTTLEANGRRRRRFGFSASASRTNLPAGIESRLRQTKLPSEQRRFGSER